MLYVVLFEDNLNLGADVRWQNMPAHLVFLERNAGRIKAAGPLRALSGEPAGGLWMVEADDPENVHALVKEDVLAHGTAQLGARSELVASVCRWQAADLMQSVDRMSA
jgi:uncharacterized protein YciI